MVELATKAKTIGGSANIKILRDKSSLNQVTSMLVAWTD